MTTEQSKLKWFLEFVTSSGWNLVCTLLVIVALSEGIVSIIKAIGTLWQ